MYKKIGLLFLTAAVFGQVRGACYGGCGIGPGEDVCTMKTKKCQPLVVRPQAVPKPPPLTLSPEGGPCFCKKPVVKPAVLPKPICNPGCGAYQRKIVNQNSCNNQEVVETYGGCGNYPVGPVGPVGSSYCGGDIAQMPPNNFYGCGGANLPYPLTETREQLAPADAVSLTIAYNLAQQAQNAKEDILSFGFRQMPKEEQVTAQQKKANNIPEEVLYSLKGNIVELKPVLINQKSLDEEATDELLNESEYDNAAESGIRKLSLGELGYGLAKIKPTATYVPVPPVPLPLVIPKAANCPNFQAGSVSINQVPKMESVSLPAPYPEPCPENKCKYVDLATYGYNSNCASQNSNVYVRRSGCGCG